MGTKKNYPQGQKWHITILIISSFLCFCVLVASHDSDLTNTFSNINKQWNSFVLFFSNKILLNYLIRFSGHILSNSR